MGKIWALLSCQPSAPGIGLKPLRILNRSFLLCPHQPAKRGSAELLAWRSCTNTPLVPPGPEFRYLYEHHTAKSTFQACSSSGTFPVAWARSNPALAPALCAAAVMAFMS